MATGKVNVSIGGYAEGDYIPLENLNPVLGYVSNPLYQKKFQIDLPSDIKNNGFSDAYFYTPYIFAKPYFYSSKKDYVYVVNEVNKNLENILDFTSYDFTFFSSTNIYAIKSKTLYIFNIQGKMENSIQLTQLTISSIASAKAYKDCFIFSDYNILNVTDLNGNLIKVINPPNGTILTFEKWNDKYVTVNKPTTTTPNKLYIFESNGNVVFETQVTKTTTNKIRKINVFDDKLILGCYPAGSSYGQETIDVIRFSNNQFLSSRSDTSAYLQDFSFFNGNYYALTGSGLYKLQENFWNNSFVNLDNEIQSFSSGTLDGLALTLSSYGGASVFTSNASLFSYYDISIIGYNVLKY